MLDFVDPWLENVWVLSLLLVVGFFLLVKGADWLVDGASDIAHKIGISELIIGLTVVAFGTSMPEFVVNMISASEGNSELAITNILGSNAINIFVILGLTALIWPVSSEKQSRLVDLPVACGGAALVWYFIFRDQIITHTPSVIDGTEGAALVVGFMAYMMYLTHQARHPKPGKKQEKEHEEGGNLPLWLALLMIVGGLAGLTVGGDLCVKTATKVALDLGVSDAIIGLTIVALGTSLPELATSVIAAAKKNSDLALGNCVGSCIFNVFFVLSISSCVHPLPGYDGLWLDALMALLGPAMCWLFVVTSRKKEISRIEGAILLIVYGVYLGYRLYTC